MFWLAEGRNHNRSDTLFSCFPCFTVRPSVSNTSTLDPAYNEQIDVKKTARCRGVHVVTELFNIAVNYFDAKKSAHCRRVLIVTELVISGTQCIMCSCARFHTVIVLIEITLQVLDVLEIRASTWVNILTRLSVSLTSVYAWRKFTPRKGIARVRATSQTVNIQISSLHICCNIASDSECKGSQSISVDRP